MIDTSVQDTSGGMALKTVKQGMRHLQALVVKNTNIGNDI